MKSLSLTLTRSRSCEAFVVLSADNTDDPIVLYDSPKLAYAFANLRSISRADSHVAHGAGAEGLTTKPNGYCEMNGS
jgi:hypothetical protein